MTEDDSFYDSPLFHIVDPVTGKVWHCAGHMCRSPIYQYDFNGEVICNGCMGRPDVSKYEMDMLVEVQTRVYANVRARDLTADEIGRFPGAGFAD